MKLRTKIIMGFAVSIALVVLVGVIAMIQFRTASNGFTEYRNLARDTNLSSQLQTNMLMVRMNVKDFIISGEEKDVQEYNEYLSEMNRYLREAEVEIQNPERAALIKSIAENVVKYEEAFKEVQTLQASRNDLVHNNLDIKGPEIEKRLTSILESAERDQDSLASYHAAITLRHLLLARLYVVKFLDENKTEHVSRVKEEFDSMDESIRVLGEELENVSRRNELNSVIELKKDYTEKFDELVDTITKRDDVIENTLDVLGPEIAGWADDVTLSVKSDQDILGPQLQKSNSRAMIMIIVILGIAILLGVVIAILTVTSILKQLGSDPAELEILSQDIARGDLMAKDGENLESSIGVYNSMLVMKDKLTEIVSSVLAGSEQIASASEELASGNQDLSNRTEQQASALEETSSAIEEMNASVKSNADNTASADQLSRDAVTKAEQGAVAVKEMVTSMNEINDSSTRIADIIEVINNIAFQTNLLALNASIEAARAGEQGKGFAVVAVEVRKLAKRSDRAASEIADIIKDSRSKVEEGVDVANSAGGMLEEINAAIKKVTALVAEISAASQEQLSSVDQIDKTLASLDENTQKNAALVEESASATEELSAQAQELNTTMQFFKLDLSDRKKRKETTAVRLLKEPKKPAAKSEPTSESKPDSFDSYETFSDLAGEGEFDEF